MQIVIVVDRRKSCYLDPLLIRLDFVYRLFWGLDRSLKKIKQGFTLAACIGCS